MPKTSTQMDQDGPPTIKYVAVDELPPYHYVPPQPVRRRGGNRFIWFALGVICTVIYYTYFR